ncbi:unnamed protein product [Medioppia subpectinata]|uniref:Uncharacterized protein n=1 Tax=Medioppia subpectinata TaxID=1979941 RepID=A0A7R9KPU3_9ACAR|nr:unnamed protein product [Medioppia subpectinata]CAG2106448.1 unnamed protein product [Medioppia subpectinata]
MTIYLSSQRFFVLSKQIISVYSIPLVLSESSNRFQSKMANEGQETEGRIPRTLSTSALRIKNRYSFWERLHSTPRRGGPSGEEPFCRITALLLSLFYEQIP